MHAMYAMVAVFGPRWALGPFMPQNQRLHVVYACLCAHVAQCSLLLVLGAAQYMLCRGEVRKCTYDAVFAIGVCQHTGGNTCSGCHVCYACFCSQGAMYAVDGVDGRTFRVTLVAIRTLWFDRQLQDALALERHPATLRVRLTATDGNVQVFCEICFRFLAWNPP